MTVDELGEWVTHLGNTTAAAEEADRVIRAAIDAAVAAERDRCIRIVREHFEADRNPDIPSHGIGCENLIDAVIRSGL